MDQSPKPLHQVDVRGVERFGCQYFVNYLKVRERSSFTSSGFPCLFSSLSVDRTDQLSIEQSTVFRGLSLSSAITDSINFNLCY